MDGEEGRAAEGGRGGGEESRGWFFLSSLSFLFESKLNLNSVVPYADLHRNVPYAFKFTEQHQRQTLNETSYLVDT